MGKKRRPIDKMNEAWAKRKTKYENSHKYAGDPFLLIDRAFTSSNKENSPKGHKTQN